MATINFNTPVLFHFEQHLVFTGLDFFFSVSLIGGGSTSSLGQPTTLSLEEDDVIFFLLKNLRPFNCLDGSRWGHTQQGNYFFIL